MLQRLFQCSDHLLDLIAVVARSISREVDDVEEVLVIIDDLEQIGNHVGCCVAELTVRLKNFIQRLRYVDVAHTSATRVL